MRIFEIYQNLFENRAEWIVKNLGSKLENAVVKDDSYRGDRSAASIVQELLKADPENGKNLQWIATQYTKGAFKMEDLARTRERIALFLANKNSIANRDLNSYADMGALLKAIEPFASNEKPAGMAIKDLNLKGKGFNSKIGVPLARSGNRILLDTPNMLIVVPENLDASRELCSVGGNVDWCTKNTDEFARYSKQGPLYAIFVKRGNEIVKYQFHVESDQYKDKRDQDLNKNDIKLLSSYPEYTTFLNDLIQKHYKKYFDAA